MTDQDAPRTLSIDIGGTHLKASALDGAGKMLMDEVKVKTPYPCLPKVMLRMLDPIKEYDRISVGQAIFRYRANVSRPTISPRGRR